MKATIGQVSLPYPEPDGTSTGGWSGSGTSKERAVTEAADGTMQKRQLQVLTFLHQRKWSGATWKEVSKVLNLHHGQSSGALSNLHKADRVVRLTHKRRKCAVYVHPDFVDGRPTAPYGRRKPGTEQGGTESQPAPEPTAAALLAAEGVGYQKGLEAGRRIGEQEAFDATSEFISRLIMASKPTLAVTHHSGCYAKHPVCAMRAIQTFVSKTGAMV